MHLAIAPAVRPGVPTILSLDDTPRFAVIGVSVMGEGDMGGGPHFAMV